MKIKTSIFSQDQVKDRNFRSRPRLCISRRRFSVQH